VAHRHPQATHFAVAALVQHDPKPGMPVGGSLGRQPIESRPAIFELYASLQLLKRRGIWLMPHAYQIFALDFGGWMHQPVGELAVGRKQQQT